MSKALDRLIKDFETDVPELAVRLRRSMIALCESIYDRKFEYSFNDDCVNDVDTLNTI